MQSIPSHLDIPASNHPTDSVSCFSWLSFQQRAFLGVSSWDSKVRVYEYEEKLGTTFLEQKTCFDTPDPCLSIAFFPGLPLLIIGCIDGSLSISDMSNPSETTTLGKHDDAIKDIHILENGIILSTSYDKTIRVWDLNQKNEVAKIQFDDKIYCSDFQLDSLKFVAGFSNDKLLICNIMDLQSQRTSDLPYVFSPLGSGSQLSAIAISKHDNALGLTSSDGRANVSTLVQNSNGRFRLDNIVSFKCHKLDPGQGGNTSSYKILFPVHSIGFHPEKRHSLFTAGGEGSIHFWDSQRKDRLKTLSFSGVPVTKAKLNDNGTLLAYALGYDWAKGIEGAHSYNNSISVHKIQPNEYVHSNL